MKYRSSKLLKLFLFLVIGASVTFSCDVTDPGTPTSNSPPDTRLTAGPPENTVTTPDGEKLNYLIHMFWIGSDIDGEVVSYDIAVNDSSEWIRTTKTDSIFVFSAPSGEEGDINTFYVRAIDNLGAVDPTPSIRSFTAHTVLPNTIIRGVPSDGAVIGRGARFQILGRDDDGDKFTYSYSLDSPDSWSEWQEDSAFVFATDDVPGTLGLLEVGEHILYARVRDLSNAVDPSPDSISFEVVEGFRPALRSTLSEYDGLPIYWDGSIFASPDSVVSELEIRWVADVDNYYGTYFQSRYNLDGGAWSEWDDTTSVIISAVQPGEHLFTIESKDLAGELDTLIIPIDIFNPNFINGIIIVDENDGRLASDDDVDAFYRNIITSTGRSVDLEWSLKDEGLSPTPRMFHDHSVVIWYGDENPISNFESNNRLIMDYLDRGGNLLLGGMQPVSALSLDLLPISYAESSIQFDYFKLDSANTIDAGDLAGALGVGGTGYPSVAIDPDKIILPTWNGNLAFTDIFTLRDGVSNLSKVLSFDSDTDDPISEGAACGIRYLGDDYSFVLLGFALYYTVESDAVVLMDKILSDFGE